MAMSVVTTTGEDVRERRMAASITQRQLAVKAEISLTTLSNLEAGLVPRRSEAIGRILAALDEAERA